jgi:predicted membrane protein
MTMTRQVQNRQGRIINPLHAILFVLALLVFLFTVIYRMVKSGSFNIAMATLVESLLVVSFFIFLGILFAYLIYFIHERIRRGSRRQHLWDTFVEPSALDEPAGKPDFRNIAPEPDDEVKSRPNA